MATSIIEKVTNDSGTNSNGNYCKMPDGTLIQWGLAGAYKESSRADTDVTMPHSFVGNYNIYVTSSFYSDATNYEVLCTAVQKTQNIITVHQKNINANQVYYFNWLTIGRWK